jgi:hypothetical protein
LLSNFVFTFFDTNSSLRDSIPIKVVICFQTLYLRSLIPTNSTDVHKVYKLWFAFKLCIYVLWYQLLLVVGLRAKGCDLLSNFVFTFFDTNFCRGLAGLTRLWFAFKLCIYVLWYQQTNEVEYIKTSCDLLSNFVFTFFDTNTSCSPICANELWFAFKLCIYVLWYQHWLDA